MPQTVYQRILDEASQSHALRRPLIEKISDHFGRKTVSFYTSFSSEKGIITDEDVSILQDLIKRLTCNGKKLLLIISSPGGDPLAAERIIKICREFSSNDYWVLVPGKAKSAGTMISLGASKMLMTPTSELGPIDIQVPWGGELVPAHVIISAFEELMEKGQKLPPNERIEPILQQLQVFNAPYIEKLKLSRDLSKDIAHKVLREGMFKDVPEDELAQLLHPFINPEQLKAHGRPVFFSDIQEIDKSNRFKVEVITPDNDIFETIHEYHMRISFHMSSSALAKMCETAETALSIPIR